MAHQDWPGFPSKICLLMANTAEYIMSKALTFWTQAYVEEVGPLKPRPVEKYKLALLLSMT